MSEQAQSGNLASQFEIKVAGTALAADQEANVMDVLVEQHTHLPAYFQITVYDAKFDFANGKMAFDLTKEVEIAGFKEDGSRAVLVKGEITAIEPMFKEGMIAYTIISGYDKSHRLYRESKSQAFLNIKDSDLASQIASNAGLSPQIDVTTTVYDHIYQDNQTDIAFLRQRAWRIGYECFVQDGKLFFRKPPASGNAVAMSWGQELIEFRPRMTLAEQVDEVQVKGWDPQKKEAILGKATKGTLYPQIGDAKLNSWASSFGTGKHILVDVPVVSQAEADKIAQARLDEISGAEVEAEGKAFRRPDILAGAYVEIKNVGSRFSGKYLVTRAQHRLNEEGLYTTFSVKGARTGLVADEMLQQRPLNRWPGAVVAIVTNTDDPEDWGRVKVKYPWMTDEAESWWARLAAPGAGPEAGFINIPEVDDEVLIVFEHGDFNQPIIVGGLWNGKNAIPPPTAGAGQGEKPQVRTWQTLKGHWIAMYDNADDKIEIVTVSGHTMVFDDQNKVIEINSSGGHKMVIDDQGKKIEISSSGGHKIVLDDNGRKASVESIGDVQVKAAMNMKLEASANIDIQASGMVNIKGSMVNIN